MKQTLKLHGRTHLPIGSDPIPGIGGDYVFLDEFAAEVDEAIEITDITQDYRHLVLELSLRTDVGNGPGFKVNRDMPGGGWFSTANWVNFGQFSTDNPTAAVASWALDDAFMRAPDVMADADLFGEEVVYTQGTLKLGYYSRSDRVKSVTWHAVCWKEIAAEKTVALAVGGGTWGDYTDLSDPDQSSPITALQIDTTDFDGFSAGSLISMYGIR